MAEPNQKMTNRTVDRFRQLMTQAIHLQQQGNFAAAETIYSTILAEKPGQPDALHFLGLLKHQRDGSRESIDLIRKSLDSGLPNAGYLANFGRVLQQQGHIDESIKYFEKALALSPTYAEAWDQLGQSYELMLMTFKACDCYRKAYAIDPTSPDIAVNLARALHATGELGEAMEVCEQTLKSNPQAWPLLYLQIFCLMETGKASEALEKMRAALRADPLSAELHHNMGMLNAELGEFDVAKQHFGKSLNIDPQHYQTYFNLSAIANEPATESAVSALEQQIRKSPPRTRFADIAVRFGLGNMLEKQGEYDRAFAYFRAGNMMMRDQFQYDSSAQVAFVESLASSRVSDYLASCKSVHIDSAVPIFIVGMPRSGTSLVEQILAGHSHVSAGGELPFLHQSLQCNIESIAGENVADKVMKLPADRLRTIAERYVRKLSEYHVGAERVTDKLPGNFMLIGLIRKILPNAKIIHCQRDPLDTCVSCYLTLFESGNEYTYDLAEIGEYYRAYQRVMLHWQETVDPGSIFTVSYENLVNDIESGARSLIEFCGLEWDPACTDFENRKNPVRTASLYQVRQPVYKGSIGRSQRYASQIESLRQLVAQPSVKTL